MRLIRDTRQRAARDAIAVTRPSPAAVSAPDDERLSSVQREDVDGLLKQFGVGDAIARKLFLAALDYQVSAFSRRVDTLDSRANAAMLERACVEAANQLRDSAPDDSDSDDSGDALVQQLCVSFVSEIARTYDACFETPPTADRQGPFNQVLANLRDASRLPPLACNSELIQRAISAAGE